MLVRRLIVCNNSSADIAVCVYSVRCTYILVVFTSFTVIGSCHGLT